MYIVPIRFYTQIIKVYCMYICTDQSFIKLVLSYCGSNQNLKRKYILLTISDGDPLISRKRILIHISGGPDSTLIFIKHFLSALKISKTFF